MCVRPCVPCVITGDGKGLPERMENKALDKNVCFQNRYPALRPARILCLVQFCTQVHLFFRDAHPSACNLSACKGPDEAPLLLAGLAQDGAELWASSYTTTKNFPGSLAS